MNDTKFTSFKDFYPYYLSEHKLRINKILHAIGSLIGLSFLIYVLCIGKYKLILVSFVFGYTFSWIGHFFFEKNKPAAFSNILWAKACDWIMLKDIITGKIKW